MLKKTHVLDVGDQECDGITVTLGVVPSSNQFRITSVKIIGEFSETDLKVV